MAHTASHPECASAVLARNAPVAFPPQMCAPNTVLKRLRASGATDVISVWFATSAERSPQSSSTAPAITAPTHKGGERERDVRREHQANAGRDDGKGAAAVGPPA